MPIPIIVATIAAIMGLIGFLLHVWNDRRKQWNAIAEEFRSAFLSAITRLETQPGFHRNILNEEFRKHEKAAIAFRQHLGRRVSAFDKAWQKYETYAKKQTDVPLLAFLGTEVLDLNKATDPAHVAEVATMRKKECLAHINPLLAFAKPK